MALIECHECKKEISDETISCPKCGYPLRYKHKVEKRNELRKKIRKLLSVPSLLLWTSYLFGLFTLWVVFVILHIIYSGDPTNEFELSLKILIVSGVITVCLRILSKKLDSPT
jgi:uncharacterized membrane protein YvbJ